MYEENISVIRVRDKLLVTIPSDPSDQTISLLQEKVLGAMEHSEASGLVLDVSMVETLDSYFARTIVETTDMVAMMGGTTVIAGMQPIVAITVTQLGLSLGRTQAALDVDRALELLDTSSNSGEESWRAK